MGRPRTSEADPLGKGRRGPKAKSRPAEARTGFDGQANAPWRKTVSIFKQPVTLVHTTSRDSKKPLPEQLKKTTKTGEKPVPMMWARSLSGLMAMTPMSTADKVVVKDCEYIPERLELAGRMERASDSMCQAAAAATLFSALHNPRGVSVMGQNMSKKDIDANPFTNLNPDQPVVTSITVGYDDIQQQEKRVLDARRRLQEVRKHFG